ncbi:uncharacterized protein KY384_000103 [Bacidia gigantensis]|uniref:uncharacterized protein n=1 Tax=Bacidia gigantensis TaxID=2732470 RepID=UPI001D04D1D0|nr:uncharacterized protein KY384_000103 [Bacidia gigantensis]KAG8526110.1 hypothetical protein KY384_000103 [Bacidia gigantensis]
MITEEQEKRAIARENDIRRAGSEPINATFVRRASTLVITKLCGSKLLLKLSTRWRKQGVLFLPGGICIKHGVAEANTIQFIAKNTTIPVPKIYAAFRRKHLIYSVMERIDGEMLHKCWPKLSEESKAKIFHQLKLMIRNLHSLKPVEGVGCENVNGGPIYDGRMPFCPTIYFGPFKSGVSEFHRWLRSGLDTCGIPDVQRFIDWHRSTDWPLQFTHGDLSTLNIMVKGDKVVGIVDWETAGWYPAYWEYTSARYANPRNFWWSDYIDNFLEPLSEAREMDLIRLEYWGPI